jgi:hypothetical protein
VRLEGLGELKYPITSSGMESATFGVCSIVPQLTKLLRACCNLPFGTLNASFAAFTSNSLE